MMKNELDQKAFRGDKRVSSLDFDIKTVALGNGDTDKQR